MMSHRSVVSLMLVCVAVTSCGGASQPMDDAEPKSSDPVRADVAADAGSAAPAAAPEEDHAEDEGVDVAALGKGSDETVEGAKPTWQDEFNTEGSALNPQWGEYHDSAPTNQGWLSRYQRTNAYVSHAVGEATAGVLRLRVTKGSFYAGGGVELNGRDYVYGRWVVRARFVKGTGNVGYIGLFGKTVTEVDFAEVAGKTPTENTFTEHSGKNDMQVQQQVIGDWTGAFHEYTVIWEPGKLTWLVDGVVKKTMKPHFGDTEGLRLGMGAWVAGTSALSGPPTANTTYPAYMDVDYVRFYANASTKLK
jgi:beta-glucanase (GH16 family)